MPEFCDGTALICGQSGQSNPIGAQLTAENSIHGAMESNIFNLNERLRTFERRDELG